MKRGIMDGNEKWNARGQRDVNTITSKILHITES